MEQLTSQKHLGIHLDEKLDFNVLIKEKISKANRGIGLIKKQQSKLCIPSKYFELRAWGGEKPIGYFHTLQWLKVCTKKGM